MPAGSGDRWPDDYERGRPGWPREAVELAGLPSSATVLDLGAGTGKLTRELVAAFDRVVAVEPADPMRARLAEISPEAEALAGTAQEIPLSDRSVDAIFAAEAFHWFHDDRALAEIERVLRPGAALVSASGATVASRRRIGSAGSTAITRPNLATSKRVSFPVPAASSSTVDDDGRPATSTTSFGQPGRPRS